MAKGHTFIIRTRGQRRKRFEVWRCFDFGSNMEPVYLECEDSFDNYLQAAARRDFCIAEMKRAGLADTLPHT
jgi:hypothetical protein